MKLDQTGSQLGAWCAKTFWILLSQIVNCTLFLVLLSSQSSQTCDRGKLQRAHWETRCLRKEEGATHSEEFATLSDQYAAEIAKLDEQCRELRKDQKGVKECHEDNLKQKRAFVQLEQLMQIKLKVAKQELQNMAEGRWESRNSFGNSAGSYL
ncbi:unnamed protein product [Durusdinium trenchii]|uniref:Uncharacterized protein n=1 Tax=Durusdinium trenchii TaxID=1381693 RepID=A0ABP0IMU2_9DINO